MICEYCNTYFQENSNTAYTLHRKKVLKVCNNCNIFEIRNRISNFLKIEK